MVADVVVEEIGITTAAVTKAVGKATPGGGNSVSECAPLRSLFGRSKEAHPAILSASLFNPMQSAAWMIFLLFFVCEHSTG